MTPLTTEDSLAIADMVNDVILLCWTSMEFEEGSDEDYEPIDSDSYSTDEETEEPSRHATASRTGTSSFIPKANPPALDFSSVPEVSKFQETVGKMRQDIQGKINKEYDLQQPSIARANHPKNSKSREPKSGIKKSGVDFLSGQTLQTLLQTLRQDILNTWSSNGKLAKGGLDDTEWYTDDVIYQLLQNYLPERENFIVIPPAVAIFDNEELLIDAIRVAIRSALNNGIVAMPMHLHDNHWVGAIFRRQVNGTIQVIYINPQGDLIDTEQNTEVFVRAIQREALATNSPPAILDLNISQQDNDYDCGPFTVDNLVRLARFAQGHAAELDRLEGDREAIIGQAEIQLPIAGDAHNIRVGHNAVLRQQQQQPQPSSTTHRLSTAVSNGQHAATSTATKLALDKKEKDMTDEMRRLSLGNAGPNIPQHKSVSVKNQTSASPAISETCGGLTERNKVENITTGLSQMTITTGNTQEAATSNTLPLPLQSSAQASPLPIPQTQMSVGHLYHKMPPTTHRGELSTASMSGIPDFENLRQIIDHDVTSLSNHINNLAPSSIDRASRSHGQMQQLVNEMIEIARIVRSNIQSIKGADVTRIETLLRNAIKALYEAAQHVTSRDGVGAIDRSAQVASQYLQQCKDLLTKLGF